MKKFIVKTGFWALGKSVVHACRFDKQLQQELSNFPDGFTISLYVFRTSTFISWQKHGNRMIFRGFGQKIEPDLKVIIKDLTSAFKMVLARLGIAQAYARRRIAIEGNTVHAMVLTRILDRVEAYLFPVFLTKKMLKQVPKFGFKQYLINALIYLSLPF